MDSIEKRRRGLLSWLTFVAQHPALRQSPILGIFLQDTTTDYRYRMCVAYEKQIDEFARLRENATMPAIDVDTVIEARARLRCAHCAIARLMELIDHDAVRTEKQAHDRAEIDRILQSSELGELFGERHFEDMSVGLRGATLEGERYVQAQHRAVIERLHLLLDALYAHRFDMRSATALLSIWFVVNYRIDRSSFAIAVICVIALKRVSLPSTRKLS